MIARTGTATCPVKMLEKYMAMGGITNQDTHYLFRSITKSKKGERLCASGRAVIGVLYRDARAPQG